MNGSSALLPTSTTINPSTPMGAEYFEIGNVLYVVENEGRVRELMNPEDED